MFIKLGPRLSRFKPHNRFFISILAALVFLASLWSLNSFSQVVCEDRDALCVVYLDSTCLCELNSGARSVVYASNPLEGSGTAYSEGKAVGDWCSILFCGSTLIRHQHCDANFCGPYYYGTVYYTEWSYVYLFLMASVDVYCPGKVGGGKISSTATAFCSGQCGT